MITDDIQELTQKMLDTKAEHFPALTIYFEDSEEPEEPDEATIWARFVVNPDASTEATISSARVWEQSGNAVLQIMQPKALAVEEEQLDRWQIAELTAQAFKGFRGSNHKMTVERIVPTRNSDSLYLIVNLAIYWRSKRSQ